MNFRKNILTLCYITKCQNSKGMNFNLFSCRSFTTTFLLAVVCFMSVSFYACGDDKPETTTDNVATTTPANNSAQGQIVHHYICPNSCAGSGGPAAGNCPVCGSAYTHNDAWHQLPENQAPNDIAPNMLNNSQPIDFKNQANAPALPQDAPTASPAQNANGVWHYTCSAGCDGGAGAMGNCSKCGSALVHNSKYHE